MGVGLPNPGLDAVELLNANDVIVANHLCHFSRRLSQRNGSEGLSKRMLNDASVHSSEQ